MGGRFAALTNFTNTLVEIMDFRRQSRMKTKKRSLPEIKVKKSSSPKLKSFFPKSSENQKKRSSPQFTTIFGREFVGSFSPGWLFFV